MLFRSRMKSQDKFVNVDISMASDLLLAIQVSNSYEGTIHQTKDGSFLSSKGSGRKGIGISSVMSITEKYNGISNIEYKDQMFKISLLINGRRPADGSFS